MPYKGLDALKADIDDSVIRKWADTLKPKSRTKLFNFLQFWEWAKEHKGKNPETGKEQVVSYWKSGEELLADYDRCALPSNTPEEKFKHLKIAMEFVKNKGTSPSDRRTTMSAIRAFYRTNLRPLQKLDTAGKRRIRTDREFCGCVLCAETPPVEEILPSSGRHLSVLYGVAIDDTRRVLRSSNCLSAV